MTLAEFLAGLERRAAEAEAIHAMAPVADVYRTLLREFRELGELPIGSETPDRFISVAEAASRSGMSKRYIYLHKNELPFVRRIGRAIRCSERGLERWMARVA